MGRGELTTDTAFLDPKQDQLRAAYDLAGRPYGASLPAYERWCEEQERFFFGETTDPRRVRPTPNRRVTPQ